MRKMGCLKKLPESTKWKNWYYLVWRKDGMWHNSLQIYKVFCGDKKSQFSMLMMNRAVSNRLTPRRREFQLDSWRHFLMIKIAKPWNRLVMKSSISEAFQHRLNKHFLRMTMVQLIRLMARRWMAWSFEVPSSLSCLWLHKLFIQLKLLTF